MKICHVTDAHSQEDIRIFHKECVSLSKAGYDVYLVSRGLTYTANGVHMEGVGNISGRRIIRMFCGARMVYLRALEIDAEVYHFHDPELLPYCLKLKRMGKKVVFDSHENVAAQILDKGWIPSPFRRIVAGLYRMYETYAVRRIDAVVAATPAIDEIFKCRAKKTIVINNYPKTDDIHFGEIPFIKRERISCYAGGISSIRGEDLMIEAIRGVTGTLVIAGQHDIMTIREGKGIVKYVGQMSRKEVDELYGKSRCGLLLYKKAANHIEAMPNKLFEYMAAGLPVVCSDFPLWRQIIEDTQAGVCVDPEDAQEVTNAINKLMDDTDSAQRMGMNGRRAVRERYNWFREENKLIDLYNGLQMVL